MLCMLAMLAARFIVTGLQPTASSHLSCCWPDIGTIGCRVCQTLQHRMLARLEKSSIETLCNKMQTSRGW
jgi:hypothetical protein